MFCNQCGTQVPEGAQFCPNCGNHMEPEEPVSASAEGQVSAPSEEQAFVPAQEPDGVPAAEQMPAPVMPQMPEPMQGVAKSRNWLLFAGIGVAAIALLAVMVFVVSNLLLGKGGRVLKAFSATAKEAPLLVEDLRDVSDILSGDNFLVGMEVGDEELTLKGEFRNGGKDKQIYLQAEDADDESMALLCGVHSGVLRASLEGLDYAFFYDPKGENEGYLTEGFREKELRQFNALLESISSDGMSTEAVQKSCVKALAKEFKELEFEKAKERSFKVNGKKRNCKGYQVALDEENIAGFLEIFSESMQKNMKGDTADMVADAMDVLIDEIEDARFDADVSFYLYQKKLAAVVVEIEDGEIRLEFEGGDYRMQNMTFAIENDYFTEELTINSERKGKTETTTIEINGYEVEIVYDARSGEVSLDGRINGERYRLEGVYRHSGSEVSCTLDDIVIGGRSSLEDVNVTVYVKKKPGIEKYKGDKFDLGNASEDDFEDLADDLSDYMDLVGRFRYLF